MEEMEERNEVSGEDQMDCDDEALDPTWKPQQLQSEYDKAADDNDSQPRAELVEMSITVITYKIEIHFDNCIHMLLCILRLLYQGKNKREEPKGIVFLSQLLLLFQHCHKCFSSKPRVSVARSGTMLTLESKCNFCNDTMTWKSQPHLLGKFPPGNILLSFAILSAGASTTKVLRVFKHMGLLGYNEVTYYYHQRHLLFPSIVKYWRSYQKKILESLNGKEVILAGDGRHDSMGHSAKYGTYTVFCCTVGLIIHIVLLQVALHCTPIMLINTFSYSYNEYTLYF